VEEPKVDNDPYRGTGSAGYHLQFFPCCLWVVSRLVEWVDSPKGLLCCTSVVFVSWDLQHWSDAIFIGEERDVSHMDDVFNLFTLFGCIDPVTTYNGLDYTSVPLKDGIWDLPQLWICPANEYLLTLKIGKGRLWPGGPVRPGPSGGLTGLPVAGLARRGQAV
jgi:hypothetical protein